MMDVSGGLDEVPDLVMLCDYVGSFCRGVCGGVSVPKGARW